ncbi:MAG: ribosome-associated heat shock protein Hsp15 [Solirubrobacteraceae bacterium]|jgi:ribosome-associated heat shock protein Hsp15|nr:ribosome-associated heat shock protein Hsp15 [Solirubrobacteraceae bacterium]
MRIDKWLWAARLTKTRGLAAEALKAGRVTINGATAKPAREVKPGDRLELRIGPTRRTLTVDALAERRVSAALAADLYTETAESIKAGEEASAQRRLTRPRHDDAGARPTKRDRRRLDRERGRG